MKNVIFFLLLQVEIDEVVKVFLVLKVEYKSVIGSEWKFGVIFLVVALFGGVDVSNINDKIVVQGNKVRDLKVVKVLKVKYICILKDYVVILII